MRSDSLARSAAAGQVREFQNTVMGQRPNRSRLMTDYQPNCRAVGPESHSTRNGLPGITDSDGNRGFLNLPEEHGERQGNDENHPSAIPVAGANELGGLTPNRSSESLPRRFHTVHDAAA